MTASRGEGGAAEFAEFSKVRAGQRIDTAGPKKRKGVPAVGFHDIAGAQTAVTGARRGRRLPQGARALPRDGCAAAEGRAAVRPSRLRQDAAGQGRRR